MDTHRAFDSVPSGASEDWSFDLFAIAFAVVGALVLAGFLFTAYAMLRSARASRRAGIDPFTPDTVVLAQALSGNGARPLEKRLRELDDLHQRGVISADEHRAARAKALADG